jgi:very-short-patch-repair endonuclease
MAAVLACGPGAVLSHESAAALWAIRPTSLAEIEVSVPPGVDSRRRGVRAHRPVALPDADRTRKDNIPLTSPVRTLIDLASRLDPPELERAINEADRLDLVDPESLRADLDHRAGQRGAGILRRMLDRETFHLTDSELEQRFLPIARAAGLPPPLTQQYVNGHRVDFFWPDLGLVVETDGLRYHRTPAQQALDRIRDQAHLAAGLTPLRFTRAQVRYEPGYVRDTLAKVAVRVRTGRGGRA